MSKLFQCLFLVLLISVICSCGGFEDGKKERDQPRVFANHSHGGGNSSNSVRNIHFGSGRANHLVSHTSTMYGRFHDKWSGYRNCPDDNPQAPGACPPKRYTGLPKFRFARPKNPMYPQMGGEYMRYDTFVDILYSFGACTPSGSPHGQTKKTVTGGTAFDGQPCPFHSYLQRKGRHKNTLHMGINTLNWRVPSSGANFYWGLQTGSFEKDYHGYWTPVFEKLALSQAVTKVRARALVSKSSRGKRLHHLTRFLTGIQFKVVYLDTPPPRDCDVYSIEFNLASVNTNYPPHAAQIDYDDINNHVHSFPHKYCDHGRTKLAKIWKVGPKFHYSENKQFFVSDNGASNVLNSVTIDWLDIVQKLIRDGGRAPCPRAPNGKPGYYPFRNDVGNVKGTKSLWWCLRMPDFLSQNTEIQVLAIKLGTESKGNAIHAKLLVDELALYCKDNNCGDPRFHSHVFDLDFYKRTYPYLVQRFRSDEGVRAHWRSVGLKSGFWGSKKFLASAYLGANPDVAEHSNYGSRVGAIRHYVEFGRKRNRPKGLEGLHPKVFNLAYYKRTYPFLSRKFRSDMAIRDHWLMYGIKAGFRGSREFLASAYLAANPDVANDPSFGSYWGAVRHYVLFGLNENRPLK